MFKKKTYLFAEGAYGFYQFCESVKTQIAGCDSLEFGQILHQVGAEEGVFASVFDDQREALQQVQLLYVFIVVHLEAVRQQALNKRNI